MDLLQNCRVGRSWHAANFWNLNLTFISYSFWNIRRKVLFFFYKFDEKRARTPRWVIRFTSKLQVKKKWIEGSNHQTHFWKRTIQWLFHQNFVLIEQMVSDKKIFMGISHRVLCLIKFGCDGHLGRCSEMPDTNLEEYHSRIISAKFGWDWLSSFQRRRFFLISSTLFSNLHNRSKSVKVQSS